MGIRVEPFEVGNHVHVMKRGGRGIAIVKDDDDCWRFLRMLFLLNDEHFDFNWHDYFRGEKRALSYRPEHWAAREPIVDVVAFTLMPNHFHIILHEIREGGVSLFMKRLGQSMTLHANKKEGGMGSIFQGSYRSRTVPKDKLDPYAPEVGSSLEYVAVYVMVKNTFELYPHGGLTGAAANFDAAWEWATTYQFSSFAYYADPQKHSPILEKGVLGEYFSDKEYFKNYARKIITNGIDAGNWKKSKTRLDIE